MEEISKQSEVNSILDARPENTKTIREMTAFEFCQFCLRRLNNVRVDDYEVVNLTRFVNNYNPEFAMTDEKKVDTVMRLKALKLY